MKHAVPGIMRLGGREQEVIPLRRDYEQGCFCIDYIPLVSASKDHQLLLNRVFLDRQDERSKANVEASWLHMMPADVADKAEASIDLATEGMGSNSELYPFSPVFTENHENSQNINSILGTPMVDPKSPELPGSFGVRKSEDRFQNQKLSPTGPTAKSGAIDQELDFSMETNYGICANGDEGE